jgi:hypothetical protein
MNQVFRNSVQVLVNLGRFSGVCLAIAFSFFIGFLLRGLTIFTVNWLLHDWKDYLGLLSC